LRQINAVGQSGLMVALSGLPSRGQNDSASFDWFSWIQRLPMLITRRTFAIGAVSLAGANLLGPALAQEESPAISIKKDPWCGCCTGWARHLEQAGFAVDVEEIEEMEAVKDNLGVPAELRSCHTATIEGYVVEGHVPAEAILALLEERPQISGLAVAGMPIGSPGMEGPGGGTLDAYDVVAFDGQGDYVYMRFIGPDRVIT
jgi:hypothetical protein